MHSFHDLRAFQGMPRRLDVLVNNVTLIFVSRARCVLFPAHEPGGRFGEAEAKLSIPSFSSKRSSSSLKPNGPVAKGLASQGRARPRPAGAASDAAALPSPERPRRPRRHAAPDDTIRAALPSGVLTEPRRACSVFAHAMSRTSPSSPSSGTTYLTKASSGIGSRSKGCCFWLLAFCRAARFAGRRAGFAEGLALGLAVLFVGLRGGIVSRGAACADIAESCAGRCCV